MKVQSTSSQSIFSVKVLVVLPSYYARNIPRYVQSSHRPSADAIVFLKCFLISINLSASFYCGGTCGSQILFRALLPFFILEFNPFTLAGSRGIHVVWTHSFEEPLNHSKTTEHNWSYDGIWFLKFGVNQDPRMIPKGHVAQWVR